MPIEYRPPPDHGLDIVYQDADLLVLNKPSGLLAVPGRGAEKADSLSSRVQREFPQALVVHRLDLFTSGLMMMALSGRAQSVLGRLFQQREVHKEYLAVVAGRPEPSEGRVELPLITDWPNRPRQRIDHAQGKSALTHYRAIAYDADADTTRMQLSPHTGRTHQLRVHMLALGHPILGDELYAPPRWRDAAARLLLHARTLAFAHPISADPMELICEPDF